MASQSLEKAETISSRANRARRAQRNNSCPAGWSKRSSQASEEGDATHCIELVVLAPWTFFFTCEAIKISKRCPSTSQERGEMMSDLAGVSWCRWESVEISEENGGIRWPYSAGDIPWNLSLIYGRYLQWIGSCNVHSIYSMHWVVNQLNGELSYNLGVQLGLVLWLQLR